MTLLGWLFLFSGLLSGTQSASTPDPGIPLIRNYTVLDYGAEAQNWAIAQDPSGILYFGNNHGVLMFDGTQWDLISIANHSMVTALEVDDSGRLYVGGAGEFGYLKPDSLGRPMYVSLSDSLVGEAGIFGKVWNVHATNHGVYFRARERMFRFDGEQLEVLPLLSHKRSSAFANAIIFNGRDNGLWVVDEKGTRLLPHTREILSPGSGTLVLALNETTLLLAVRDYKFFTYDVAPFLENGSFKATFQDDVIGPVPWENEIEAYLLQRRLYMATATKDGFAFGTRNGGIVITDRQGKLSRILNRDHGLFDHRIHALAQDHHGNLWTALNNGLAQIEINSPFALFPSGNGSHEGVISIGNFNRQLYLGAHNGLFHQDANGIFTLIDEGTRGYWSFFPYKGRLLTASNEIFEIHGSQFQIIETNHPKKLTTYCMGTSPRFPDHLFTGNRDGIRVIRTGSAEQRPLQVTEDFYLQGLHEEIRRITPDELGNLWLSTRLDGLIYLQFSGDDPRDFRIFRYGRREGLERLDHCKIARIGDDWKIATRNGVYHFDPSINRMDAPEDIRFLPDPAFERFKNQTIYQLFEDGAQRTWVITNREMGYFAKNKEGSGSIWHGDLLNRIGEGYLHITPDNELWIDASMGLYHYTGDFKPSPRTSFQTLIRSVSTHNQLLDGGFPRSNPDSHKSWPVLALSQDNMGGGVSFSYSASFFVQSEANRFRYILEGYDKGWSDWSKETHTNYTNLPGGTYRFRVESKNLYHQRGSIATVEIAVPYPWYHTSWAYAVFGLGLLTLLLGAVFTTAVFQKRRNERRRQYEIKQQEIQKFETLGRLAGGIAHDFNGILATIYGFTHHIEKATREMPGVSLPFEEIEKAGKRGKDLVSQILAFSRGDKPQEKLLSAGPELHRALNLAQVTMPPKVTLIRRIDRQAGWIKGDPTRLYQVVVNLFRNAVQALDGQAGTIEVGLRRIAVSRGSATLHFWVKDTGTGMDDDTQRHLFEPFYTNRRRGEGTGLGLWVVHGIVQTMGGTIEVNSTLGVGSVFHIHFPSHPQPVLEEATIANLPKGQGQRILWIDSAKQRLREGILLLRQLDYKASGALMHEVPLADLERQPQAHDLIVLGGHQDTGQTQSFLARIRELRPDIPVICCVAKKDSKLKGFQAQLEEPISPQPLAQALINAFSIKPRWKKGVIS